MPRKYGKNSNVRPNAFELNSRNAVSPNAKIDTNTRKMNAGRISLRVMGAIDALCLYSAAAG